MREKLGQISSFTIRIISSRRFFWFIIVLFILQAVWIALSFRYSMIYDEYYHFGLIEYFSHQWSPWIHNQPVSLDQYGSLERDPYLLYHYLLSFPFRLINLFIHGHTALVISMRIVNIALFTSGLVSFWYLFKEMNIGRAFRNVTLLFFVLLPVTPFVAATVNYDNLLVPLTALFMLIGVKIVKSQTLKWHLFALIILIGMVGSLTKSAFPPIFAAGFIFLILWVILKKKNIIRELSKSFVSSSILLRLVILLPLIIIGLLFAERFGRNVIQYHSLSPGCERQLSKNRCSNNFVELRGQTLKSARSGAPVQAPQYSATWFTTMESGLLVTGANTAGKFGTKMGQSLPIIYMVVFIGSIVSFAAIFYYFDYLRRIPGFWFIVSITLLYVASLFYVNISAYYTYYQPLAVQGRYLIPLLPIIMLFGLLGINHILRNSKLLKVPILLVVSIFYLNGAGLITHIMRSDDSWDWNNKTVRQINDTSRDVLRPLIKEQWYK